MEVPEEFANAARVEGANEWQVFLQIMVPLARSGMLTVLIFAFVWAWNDILLPVAFLADPNALTVPYGIAALRPADFRQDYVSIFAGSFLSTIPMILIYVFLMRQFIQGISVGGLKF
jgi:multiple sugar transport system permease protein